MTNIRTPHPASLFLAFATFAMIAPAAAEGALPSRLFDPAPMKERPEPAFSLIAAAETAPQETPSAEIEITAGAINAAEFSDEALPEGQSPIVARIQILLDRRGVSPGVIDGYAGENVDKAIRAFEEIHDLPVDGKMDGEVWAALQGDGAAAVRSYELTPEDVSGTVPPLPEDYAKLAELDWLGYESVAEKIAEMFHMDVEFLKALNPGTDFAEAGTTVLVADTGIDAEAEVASIVADKQRSRLLVYDSSDSLVLSYPVTIGSDDTPSPSGDYEVVGVATDPTYSDKPDVNFQQGENDEAMTLPPGPNGPVGNVWIDLSKPTFGIHGTPDPAKIGKTASHGCVRMTNWDANELAKLVGNGTPVRFAD